MAFNRGSGKYTLPDGRAVSKSEFETYWVNTFKNDPEMQRIAAMVQTPEWKQQQIAQSREARAGGESFLSAGSRFATGEHGAENAAAARAAELGYVNPDHDWSLDFQDGAYRPERANYWTRNSDWLGPLIVAGAGGIAGTAALAGAGGAAGAGAGGGAATGAGGVGAAGGAGAAGATTAGVGGGTAAATGGGVGLKAALGALERGGEVASNMAAGRGDARVAEANYGLDRDRLNLDRSGMERAGQLDLADLDLKRRTTASDLDKETIRKAILGGLLQGAEDVQIDVPEHLKAHVGKISGGLRPSAILNREQIGADLQARTMPKVKTGETFDPVTFDPLPTLSDAPKSSGLDAALNAIGLVGAGAGALSGIKKPPTTTVMPTSRTAARPPSYTSGSTTTGPVTWR